MPSKRTTKKPNSKSSLKKRFDLTNRKVQFFVVIAIVAVLGGGWFTYRSFAATSSVARTWPASDYEPGYGNPRPNTDPNKNTLITSWTLPPSSAIYIKRGVTGYDPGRNAMMRLCVSAKPASLSGGSIRFGSGDPVAVYNIQSFQIYCEPFKLVGGTQAAIIVNAGQSTLIIEKAFVGVMDGAPAPAPAPAK